MKSETTDKPSKGLGQPQRVNCTNQTMKWTGEGMGINFSRDRIMEVTSNDVLEKRNVGRKEGFGVKDVFTIAGLGNQQLV